MLCVCLYIFSFKWTLTWDQLWPDVWVRGWFKRSFLATSALPHRHTVAPACGKGETMTYLNIWFPNSSQNVWALLHLVPFWFVKNTTQGCDERGRTGGKYSYYTPMGSFFQLISHWPPWPIRFCHHCRVIMLAFPLPLIQPSLGGR